MIILIVFSLLILLTIASDSLKFLGYVLLGIMFNPIVMLVCIYIMQSINRGDR